MINKDFKDNVILINVIPLIIIPIGKDYSNSFEHIRFSYVIAISTIFLINYYQ